MPAAGARWRAACAALGLFATGCLFDTRDPAPRTRFDFSRLREADNPLVRRAGLPEGKTAMGVKFAFRSTRYAEETDSAAASFLSLTGADPALVGAYFDLSARPENLALFLAAADARGSIPYVTYDPKDFDDPDWAGQTAFAARLADGGFDAVLTAMAQVLRAFGKPVLFRFAHEMNGDWYPYSGIFTGGRADADGDGAPDGPQTFAAAWRHAHALFAAAGADNLLWTFSPNAESFPDAGWNRPFRYYPGADYVDLIAVDAYASPRKGDRRLASLLEEFLNETGLHFEDGTEPLKPLLIGEFGTSRADPAGKAEWMQDALSYLSRSGLFIAACPYIGRNGDQDFSLAGLENALRTAFEDPGFAYASAKAAEMRAGRSTRMPPPGQPFAWGNRMQNSVPSPGFERHRMRPPIFSTRDLHWNNPMPTPFSLVVTKG